LKALSLYAEADGDLEMPGCLNAMHKIRSLSKEEKSYVMKYENMLA